MHSKWGPHLLGHLQFGPLDKDSVGPTQHVIVTLHTPYAATITQILRFCTWTRRWWAHTVVPATRKIALLRLPEEKTIKTLITPNRDWGEMRVEFEEIWVHLVLSSRWLDLGLRRASRPVGWIVSERSILGFLKGKSCEEKEGMSENRKAWVGAWGRKCWKEEGLFWEEFEGEGAEDKMPFSLLRVLNSDCLCCCCRVEMKAWDCAEVLHISYAPDVGPPFFYIYSINLVFYSNCYLVPQFFFSWQRKSRW